MSAHVHQIHNLEKKNEDTQVASPPQQRVNMCHTVGSDVSVSIALSDLSKVQDCITNPEQPCFVVHRMVAHKTFQHCKLSEGASLIYNSPNAGGNSEVSEALSFEVLYRLFGIRLIKTEMEIGYFWTISKRTDYSAMCLGKRLGVSVTRAMKYRGVFTEADADVLLRKKLFGVLDSTKNVVERDSWTKQVLHVWTAEDYIVDMLHKAYSKLDASLRGNTIVIVTVSKRTPWIYSNESQWKQA